MAGVPPGSAPASQQRAVASSAGAIRTGARPITAQQAARISIGTRIVTGASRAWAAAGVRATPRKAVP